jgi:hypothetical protein
MPLVTRLALPSSLSLLWSSQVAAGGINPESILSLFGLVRMAYPHNVLTDVHYQSVVSALLDEASNSLETAEMIGNAMQELNNRAGGKWSDASPDQQMKAVNAISSTPFFGKVKHAAVMNLYNDHAVWEKFGYQGEAFSKGGYIHRGFNDLAWLPNPPEDASPGMGGQ